MHASTSPEGREPGCPDAVNRNWLNGVGAPRLPAAARCRHAKDEKDAKHATDSTESTDAPRADPSRYSAIEPQYTTWSRPRRFAAYIASSARCTSRSAACASIGASA